MPLTQTPIDPDQQPAESSASPAPPAPEAPQPIVASRIRTGRYGELEEHEIVRLLDNIEDERARGRFRESVYISVFVWLAIAWLVFYGPRYLWHAPQLINPADAIKAHELTQLNAPVLLHQAPRIVPKPVDNSTIKRLQQMTRSAPVPSASHPSPVEPTNPTPQPTGTQAPPPPPPAPAPTPRVANPAIPEAPAPQHATQPSFNTSTSAKDSLQQAIHDSAHGREGSGGGSGVVSTGKGANVGGGVQVLSDMQGVDFSEYLRRLKADIYRNWIPLLPEETEPPILKQGETYIVFTILPDGTLSKPELEASTHDVAIDKAAWGSIISEGQFPPLPKQFHGPGLTLRFHYIVNKGISH